MGRVGVCPGSAGAARAAGARGSAAGVRRPGPLAVAAPPVRGRVRGGATGSRKAGAGGGGGATGSRGEAMGAGAGAAGPGAGATGSGAGPRSGRRGHRFGGWGGGRGWGGRGGGMSLRAMACLGWSGAVGPGGWGAGSSCSCSQPRGSGAYSMRSRTGRDFRFDGFRSPGTARHPRFAWWLGQSARRRRTYQSMMNQARAARIRCSPIVDSSAGPYASGCSTAIRQTTGRRVCSRAGTPERVSAGAYEARGGSSRAGWSPPDRGCCR